MGDQAFCLLEIGERMNRADGRARVLERADISAGLVDRATGVPAHLILDHGVAVCLQGDGESIVAVEETALDELTVVGAVAQDSGAGVAE